MTDQPPPPELPSEPTAQAAPRSALETVSEERSTVVLGIIVWSLISLLLALGEVFLLPWTTSGGTHLPASMVLAVVANFLLPRVFVRGLGVRWGWAVPTVIWFVVIFGAVIRTSDGDLLIASTDFSGTYNVIFLALGALSAVAGALSATARPDKRQTAASPDGATR